MPGQALAQLLHTLCVARFGHRYRTRPADDPAKAGGGMYAHCASQFREHDLLDRPFRLVNQFGPLQPSDHSPDQDMAFGRPAGEHGRTPQNT